MGTIRGASTNAGSRWNGRSAHSFESVFWNRRLPVAVCLSTSALVGLSGFTVGTRSAFWFGVVFGFPLTAWAGWVWTKSCRLVADEQGIAITTILPWTYRRRWDQIVGFSQVAQTGALPLLPFCGVRVDHVSGRPRNCGEVGYFDTGSGRARVAQLVEQLEALRIERLTTAQDSG